MVEDKWRHCLVKVTPSWYVASQRIQELPASQRIQELPASQRIQELPASQRIQEPL